MARLPLRHHVVLWTVGLLSCVGAGAWLTTTAADTVLWHYGALAGAVIGPLLISVYSRTLAASPSASAATQTGPAAGSPDRRR